MKKLFFIFLVLVAILLGCAVNQDQGELQKYYYSESLPETEANEQDADDVQDELPDEEQEPVRQLFVMLHAENQQEIFDTAETIISYISKYLLGRTSQILIQYENDGTAKISVVGDLTDRQRDEFFAGDFFINEYLVSGFNPFRWIHGSLNLTTLEFHELPFGVDGHRVNIDNRIIAIMSDADFNLPRLFSDPLFFDQQLNLLDKQLQFDRGDEVLDELGYERGIIRLAYNNHNQTYVSIFTTNPFIAGWAYLDNSVCELGIAVFDDAGALIEEFMLENIIHPLATRSDIRPNFAPPALFILDERTALIVPQEFPYPWDGLSSTYDFIPPQEEFLLPIEVNLDTQTFRRWNEDEVNLFMQNNNQFEFVWEAFGWLSERVEEYGWRVSAFNEPSDFPPLRIRERRIPVYIQSVHTDEALLIFADGDETPLFAVPSELTLRLYHQTEDGTRYFVFELT